MPDAIRDPKVKYVEKSHTSKLSWDKTNKMAFQKLKENLRNAGTAPKEAMSFLCCQKGGEGFEQAWLRN